MSWQDLKDLCRQAGVVVRADVLTNPDGSSKGYGLVQFASARDAAAAIQMLNGRVVEGRVLTARFDRFAVAGGGGGGEGERERGAEQAAPAPGA
jgi:RNA recognition motif-containing protein